MPPRDYHDWDIDDNVREDLDRKMKDGVYQGVPEGNDPRAVEEQVGREELTARLAGTRDKSTRAWKSARDMLTRYRSGRRSVGPKNAARIRAAAEAIRRDRIRNSRQLHVEMNAVWVTSRKPWAGRAVADLMGEDLTDFLAAMEQGDTILAAQIFADAYGLDPEYVLAVDALGDISISSEGISGATGGEE